MAKNLGVSLGNSMFMDWEEIDFALYKWGKEYFGEHVFIFSDRDEDDFEIHINSRFSSSDDYMKYLKIFEVYDTSKNCKPEGKNSFMLYGGSIPGEVAKRLMFEVIGKSALASYGTALATHEGVFFMEHDKYVQRGINRTAGLEDAQGWKVQPVADELVVRMAHMAGEMESRKEIEPMEWDDLCAAINDAIKEYYDNPSETNPFLVEDIADKVLKERFGSKPLEAVLDSAKARGVQGKSQEFEFELEP